VDELCTVEMFLQMWKLLSLSISPQGGAVHTTQKNNNPETQNLHSSENSPSMLKQVSRSICRSEC